MFGPQAHHLFHHENKMFCDDFDHSLMLNPSVEGERQKSLTLRKMDGWNGVSSLKGWYLIIVLG